MLAASSLALSPARAVPAGMKGLSPFAVFLKKSMGDTSLAGLSIAERGRELGKRWRNMPAADKKALIQEAKTTFVKAKPVKNKRTSKKKKALASNGKAKPKREPSAYNMFIKAMYPSVRHLPVKERLRALSSTWKSLSADKKNRIVAHLTSGKTKL